MNLEQEIDANGDEADEQTVGDKETLKLDFGAIHMDKTEKNNNAYDEYMNSETEKPFSVSPDKTSPSIEGNDKTIMATKQDIAETYKHALLV